MVSLRLLPMLIATTCWLFIQPTNSFVLHLHPKSSLIQFTARDNINDCISNKDHQDGPSSERGREIDSFVDFFEANPIGRRESLLATTAIAAHTGIWSFPKPACASSSSSVKTGKGKPPSRNRPVDAELSVAVQKLFDLDEPNRLVPGRDYAIDVQGRKSSGIEDAAPDPLFRYVDRKVFEDRPTYRSFVNLLDNYQPNVCLEEDNTRDEIQEAYTFLRACMATPVMNYCYSYCKTKLAAEAKESSTETATKSASKYSLDTEEDFVQLLYKIWFQFYSRSKGCEKDDANVTEGEDIGSDDGGEIPNTSSKRVYGSCGFEHVFVGEIRRGKVIGFHNWIQLYRQEIAGNLDYRGTVRSVGSAGAETRVLSYNLRWEGAEKPLGTSLIGVSPEFELALYSMVYLVGQKDNVLLLDLGNTPGNGGAERILNKLNVKCFRTKGRVGSCFVESLQQ